MSLQSNDINVAGVIFAGVPGIILGHNEDVAWGVTNTGPDVQQLFVEKQNPDKEYEFLFNNEWEPAKIISETIQVKGEDTIEYEVVEKNGRASSRKREKRVRGADKQKE